MLKNISMHYYTSLIIIITLKNVKKCYEKLLIFFGNIFDFFSQTGFWFKIIFF
jgi:hypothetical protein